MLEPSRAFAASQLGQPAPKVYVLHPGDVALAQAGERLETLLGSCVAVILTDPRRTVGVMCHIVNAGLPRGGDRSNTAYAANAMQAMFTRLRAVGITPQLCHAYVFGGGNMFPALFNSQHVGAANVRWVLDFLKQQRIEILAESVGEPCYRKIGWTVGSAELQIETVPVTPDNEPGASE